MERLDWRRHKPRKRLCAAGAVRRFERERVRAAFARRFLKSRRAESDRRRSTRPARSGSGGGNQFGSFRRFERLNCVDQQGNGNCRGRRQVCIELADDAIVVVVRLPRRRRRFFAPLDIRITVRMRAAMMMPRRVGGDVVGHIAAGGVVAVGMQVEPGPHRRQSNVERDQRPANKMSGECAHQPCAKSESTRPAACSTIFLMAGIAVNSPPVFLQKFRKKPIVNRGGIYACGRCCAGSCL